MLSTLVSLPMQILRYGSRYIVNALSKPVIRQYSTSKQPYFMVASIGNPEPLYKGTRHNVGHYMMDKVVDKWTNFTPFTKTKDGVYSVCNDSLLANIYMFKSLNSFMNVQGRPIYDKWKELTLKQDRVELVVVHDEIEIPLGKVVVRRKGTSARGHNGLRSIDGVLPPIYTKIGIGVGKPSDGQIARHVLSKFSDEEEEVLKEVEEKFEGVLREVTK